MTQASPSGRIQQLQSLRFFAAAVVLYGHVLMEMRQHGSGFGGWTYDLPWGGGVDIFFVISGFIMLFISGSVPRTARAAADFLIKRVLRIAPLYWFFTLLMALVVALMASRVAQGSVRADELVRSLLFIPYVRDGEQSARPLLGQGWTLNYEFFFYTLFALVLALTARRFLWTTVILAALTLVGALVPLPPALAFLCGPILLLFAAGLALAHWHGRLPRHGTPVAIAMILGVALWSATVARTQDPDPWLRLVLRGVPAILLVYALLLWRSPPRALTHGTLPLLGDASYALYLSHPFVVNAMLIAFIELGLELGGLFAIVTALAAIAVSVIVFYLLEKPLLRWTTRTYRRSTFGIRGGGKIPVRADSLAFQPDARS